MRKAGFILSLLITIALTWALNIKIGDIPPLGKFFNPFSGFWQNAEDLSESRSRELKIEGLKDKVSIILDENLVPHIFAENDDDLNFAHGYVTAMLRLWQMDFQAMYSMGRLCEIVGEKALALDRFQRKIGMQWAAKKSLEYSMKDENILRSLDNYTAGVNYYIENLKNSDLPFEFKLLDYKPEKWTNLKSQMLLSYMAWDLSGYNTDLKMTNVLNEYGMDVVNELFNSETIEMEPIIPRGTEFNFDTLDIPDVPDVSFSKNFASSPKALEHLDSPDPDKGSNNWAIAGSKSKTGLPILSSDMHLSLTLPALWMQIQLVSPSVNVYGVSLQGAPIVVVGFNENIAWGPTNVDPDILDWYSIKFKDTSLAEYYHDGRWKSTDKRHEIIKIRGGDDFEEDIIHTHHGPVVFKPGEKSSNPALPSGCAMRWLTHEPSNAFKCFQMINRADNYEEFVDALNYFYVPAQNFCYIDNRDNIAIWSNGKFPLKWKGQGQFILDGTRSDHEWQDYIPQHQNPHIKNPERAFISSANQDVTDSTYPYYLNWEFTTFERGARINDLLEQLENATWDDLRQIQNDYFNLQAELAVPRIIEILDKVSLNDGNEKKSFSLLKNWKFVGAPESIAMSIYHKFWENFRMELWRDEFGGEPIKLIPDNTQTLEILLDSIPVRWIDNINTSQKENISDLVLKSFKDAVTELEKDFGDDFSNWQWAKVKGTYIENLARIPALSSEKLWVGGGHNMINASKEKKGPSWRMIVEVGKKPKGYGVYPGGQSGNPGSKFYDNMVQEWASGELRELHYLYRIDELEEQEGIITFNPK